MLFLNIREPGPLGHALVVVGHPAGSYQIRWLRFELGQGEVERQGQD